ncbi:trimeric LpxA-like protein [Fimicolochytrium jonesii]|uniref:trimeric LpxA-like protein n=1 Tax=Fimicolochytrium jonesii TaxID=1396493 RepID=UPI0022FDD29A|nr:trimeric LpxA-like protein [Fimicolochytrium jonesii]KAI8815830.1 trimeric LpxA-like protein [Fimicolochytrium jonesii]
MEDPPIYYDKAEYIETDTGNKVSRKSVICGSQNIVLGGKTVIQKECIIRGDLRRTGPGHTVVVAIGRYCLLSQRCVIRPPYKTYKGVLNYYPMKIADHVTIGEDSVIEAAQVGSYVEIGKNCVIGRFAIIKDCSRILDGSVVAPNTVIPSFSVYAGNPAQLVDELPESTQELLESSTKEFYYERFLPQHVTSR